MASTLEDTTPQAETIDVVDTPKAEPASREVTDHDIANSLLLELADSRANFGRTLRQMRGQN